MNQKRHVMRSRRKVAILCSPLVLALSWCWYSQIFRHPRTDSFRRCYQGSDAYGDWRRRQLAPGSLRSLARGLEVSDAHTASSYAPYRSLALALSLICNQAIAEWGIIKRPLFGRSTSLSLCIRLLPTTYDCFYNNIEGA